MKRRSQTQAAKGSLIPQSTPSRSQSLASLPSPPPKPTSITTSRPGSRRSKLLDSTNLLRTSLPEELLQGDDEVDWRARVGVLEAENVRLRAAEAENARLRGLEAENSRLRGLEAENARLRGLETENTKLRSQLASVSSRPTQRAFDDLKKDYDVIESILDGTQKENAHAEEQIKFLRERQRKLEDALARFVGPSWAELADVPPLSTGPASRRQSKLYGDEHITVLPTLEETSFASSRGPQQEDEDMEQEQEQEQKSLSVTPTVQRLATSATSGLSRGSISDTLLDLYDNSSVDLEAEEGEAVRSRQPSRASNANDPLTASMLSLKDPLTASMLDVSTSHRPSRVEEDPAFQRMEFRVRALETIVKSFMSRAVPEHAGELSMVRDELEVEGFLKEL
ncbi:hypothetical protein CALCODRAFT_509524 [Calocera cornea HHB12733]|uniref:Uncharacterized protein n=1 Tax=Calocera cornea HHB12733 TaxID=1353952 RepID=A0A165F805_9BASI|nr:hypothetical protein CALCODRAFT_509524 [Calocera cornea HHB12733]